MLRKTYLDLWWKTDQELWRKPYLIPYWMETYLMEKYLKNLRMTKLTKPLNLLTFQVTQLKLKAHSDVHIGTEKNLRGFSTIS